MKFTRSLCGEYYLHLKPEQPQIKKLHNLTKGKYKYCVRIQNPLGQSYKLHIIIKGNQDKKIYEIKTSEAFVEKEIFLQQTADFNSSEITIHFTLEEGAFININFPVSPSLLTSVSKEDKSYLKIIAPVEASFRQDYLESLQHNNPPTEKVKPDFIAKDFFEGCLSISDAEKQLEYVVYHKWFIPDGSKGFLKWKRAFYRVIFKGIYKAFTKNTHRKRYFAKLYRNYVNNSIIAENLEKTS